MESKVLKVFYGNDLLPYKDSERQVHFPVGGNAFAGSSYTNSIRFYVDHIGGTSGITWVVVSKLPNGKLGYEILTSVATDSDLGVDYLNFTLSSYYTQYKGIVQLALRGYNGEITFTQNDQGVYVIQGTPIIEVTGTISLAINYSPMVVTGNELLPTDVDQILAAMSGYVLLQNGFVVLASTPSADDLAQYDEGQLFYIKSDKTFYKLESGSLVYYDLGVSVIELSGTSGTLSDNDFANLTSGKGLILRNKEIYHFNYKGTNYWNFEYINNSTMLGVITFEKKQITIQEDKTWSYADTDFTGYTQSKIDSMFADLGSVLAYQGTKTVAEINALDTSTLKTGYVYNVSDSGTITLGSVVVLAGDNVAWNGTGWDKLAGTVDLSGYLQKSNSVNKVYGTDGLGNQTLYTVDDFYDGNIARRDSDGSITVPLTPSSNGEASSKKYVDDTTTTKVSALQSDLETGAVVPLQAKNIAPISEESGATQETPFVYQGTGTANGTASVDTSPVGKQLEKQGNSVVVNQIMPNGTFTSPWSQQDASNSVSSNVCTATFNNNNGKLINNISNGIVGHTYLMTVDAKAVDVGSTVQVFMFIGSNYALVQKTGITSWTKLYCIQTVTELFSLPQVQLRNSTASSVSDTTVQFRNACLFDLTQWFGSNDNIPSDLLSHPENFFRYYNGSLAYNTGTLENANGRYLETGGRNVWDETFGSAYEGRYGSANLINVIPNTEYAIKCPYFYDIKAYDKDQNEIGYLNTTQLDTNVYKFKTSSNAKYIKFSVGGSYGSTYKNDITISLYYATGDGYSEYYPYETPKVYDTGVEVLRSAGSFRDIKKPSGEITRNIGTYTFTSNESWTWYANDQFWYFSKDGLGAIATTNTINKTGIKLRIGGSGANVIRAYVSDNPQLSSSSNMNTLFPSGVVLYYPLATPTTESGTPFAENIEINDYGTMGWKDTNSAYVSIPQGCKIFYPADYVLFIDSLGQYSDWTATKVIRTYETNAEKLVANPNVNDNWDTTPTLNSTKPVLSGGIYESDTILQNAIGGTLRHCLAIQEAGLNFEDTDFVDLGTLSWSSWNTHEVGHETWRTSNAIANIKTPADNNTKPKALCSLYVVDTVGNAYNHVSNLIVSITTDGKVNIYDSTHTDYANATAFKNAMKGVLFAYEKA